VDEFALALGDKARSRGFDIALQLLEKGFLLETWRDGIEDLDQNSSRITAHGAARPEQAGIERDRKTRNGHL
jgi:hypothetical protein